MIRSDCYAILLAVTAALIALLQRESIVFHAPSPGGMTEGYSDYVGDLVVTVASLESPQAVEALVGMIETGWGAMNGLVRLGTQALPSLLRVADSTNAGVRTSAAYTLGRMVEKQTDIGLSASDVSTIRLKLMQRATDADPYVRAAALQSLITFRDSAVRAIAVQALQDTFILRYEGSIQFPVRDAAREWLRGKR